MRIKKELLTHKSNDEVMLIPVGKLSQKFQGIVRGNETAGFIMEQLKEDLTEEELIERVLESYDVDRNRVMNDVKHIIELLEQEELLE